MAFTHAEGVWSRLVEVDSCGDFDGEDGGNEPVDGQAEGWPPARIGHEVGAVLPQVLRPVREVGDDEDPGSLGDADRGEDHETQPRRRSRQR